MEMILNIKVNRIGIRQTLISLIAFCLFSNAYAQILPLDSVLTRIENNNPALLSFSNIINADQELVKGARALPAPKAGVMFDNNPYSFGFGPKMIAFSVSQLFPNTKALNAKEDYLMSLSDIDLQSAQQLKNQLFAQAKIDYFKLNITEKKIGVIKENNRLMKSMIEISSKQLASGMGDLGSIFKMKARLADIETMQIREESMVRSLTAQLNALMAVDIYQPFLTDSANLIKDYRSIGLLSSKEMIESNRSDIQKMHSEINAMKLNQKVMSAMLRPMFELGAKHYLITGQQNQYAIEAMMMIPIAPWSAKGYKSDARSMEFRASAMEQEKQGMLNMAVSMVNMYTLELSAGYDVVKSYTEKIIPAYKKSFDANLIAYSQNTADLMKVILAWDDLQMAQMKHLEELEKLLIAQAEYERETQIR
ncbi:MAG: TolC family protein [Bacteroidia bacterium]